MLLQRIRARNYRTYLDLDLDLSVSPDRPLLLIGGKNGGGKTTLFSAISGALYGLRIPDADAFRQEMNAGALAAGVAEPKIELELAFSGQILAQVQQYVITRTWVLSSDGRVNWGVKLNMAGNVFAYGSASGDKERQAAESQVAKIVKANLPRELSEYFLFDAMNAGQKLSEDQLGKVIRENIENVMGLRKYLDLGQAARIVQENWLAERMSAKAERDEYLRLTEEQRNDESRLREAAERREMLADQLHGMKELVAELKDARSKEDVLRHRLEGMEKQRRDILAKEALYRERLDEFVKVVEPSIALPQLAKCVAGEVVAIREAFAPAAGSDADLWTADSVGAVVDAVLARLSEFGLPLEGIDRTALVGQLLDRHDAAEPSNPWAWLEAGELRALEELVRTSRTNPFPSLDQLRRELALSIDGLAQLDASCEDLRRRIAGDDYGMIQKAESLEKEIGDADQDIEELQKRLAERGRRIHQYDVRPLEEPDPRYEAAVHLRAWFEDAATELLKAKKSRIESILRDDLNRNLAAYRDVIERVELSENLRNLTFRIFHKAGNEIVLGHLNAASKQVVVQVLLKALHESGDYDPPVMIDTVMGVLDKESRETILANYFPSLSHQTILLSTDSEIDVDRDFPVLAPFVGRAWTLVRDRQSQKTEVEPGYFGTKVVSA